MRPPSQPLRPPTESVMVDFIGIERIQELVARRGVARFIEELAGEIEADFLRWGVFDKAPRHATHSPLGVIELMPASDGRLYAFKYVNGHPKNTAVGLLTVTAFGVLADVQTGYPLLLAELTLTTALRTAATSALAARRMARPDSRVMALIGNGAQSEFQTIAFHHMLGIREVRLYDTDAGASAKLEHNLARLQLPDLRVLRCGSSAEAVQGADIVTTVTADKRNATILTPPMISAARSSRSICCRIWTTRKTCSRCCCPSRASWPLAPGWPREQPAQGDPHWRAHGRGRRGPGLVHGTGGVARGGTGRRAGCAR